MKEIKNKRVIKPIAIDPPVKDLLRLANAGTALGLALFGWRICAGFGLT